MATYRIRHCERLSGEVSIHSAKNAVLPLMCACLLTREPLVLEHVPNLTDVQTLLDSQSFVQELSEVSGLPVYMTTVRADLCSAVSEHIPNVFPLQLQEKYFDLPDQRTQTGLSKT